MRRLFSDGLYLCRFVRRRLKAYQAGCICADADFAAVEAGRQGHFYAAELRVADFGARAAGKAM